MGKPPNKPLTIFPIPCALSSLLAGVTRFCGSILSVASALSRVSILATSAITSAVFQTNGLDMAEKRGKVKNPKKSFALVATGTFTRCSVSISWLPPL